MTSLTPIKSPKQEPQSGDAADYESLPLEELAQIINEKHVFGCQLGDIAKVAVQNSLLTILAAGRALIAAKCKVRHGEWKKWQESNIPALSDDQVGRYMRLAKEFPHMRKLGVIGTVRQAYIAAGIIKEPSPRQSEKENRREQVPSEDLLKSIKYSRKYWELVWEKNAWLKMSTEDRLEASKELEKVIARLDELNRELVSLCDHAPKPPDT